MAYLLSTFTEVGLIDTRNNPGTITLPTTTSIPFRTITVKDIYGNFSKKALTLSTQFGDSFEDGATSKTFSNDFAVMQLYAGGNNKWYILAGSVQTSQLVSSLRVSSIAGDGSALYNLPAISSLSLQSTVLGLTAGGGSGSSVAVSTGSLTAPLISTLNINLSSINGQALGASFTGSTLSLSAGTVTAPLISTLNINLSSINGQPLNAGTSFTGSTLFLSAGTVTAPLISTLNINLSSINGQPLNAGTSFTGSTLFLSAGTVTAAILSSLNLNICTINGQTFGGPIQSTVIGLALTGYISSSQLFSTVTNIQSTVGGSLTQPQLTSTYNGLGTGGYISSSQLISSITGLSFGAGVTGAQLFSTVASLNTGLPSATIINVSSLNAQSVSAPQALFSSLTVNALTIGTGTGLINMGDIVPTSVSTLQIRTGSNYAAKLFLGTASTNTAIQFYGLTGSYSNTVIAEMSISTATTTTGLQELLLFKGSTTSDSIRLRTTGNLVFEAGAISSVMWPNAVANSTPTMIITNSRFVGILVSTPQVELDVGGQVRAPILSTLALNVSTINGQTFGGPIQSTVIGLGATGYVSSLVNLSIVSTLTLNVSTINGQTFGGPIQSTVIGLATTGYISSTQLTSTVANIQSSLGAGGVTQPQLASTFVGLASGGYISSSQLFSSIASLNFGAGVTGGQLYSTVAGINTGLPSATLINVSALNAQNVSAPQAFISSLIVQNISAPQATISSLTVNALTIGSGAGFLSFGDIIATSLSTTIISAATLVAGTTQTSSVLIGFNSTMNTIQFYGLGQYKNTAISEQSTGTGLQELLLFKGSSVSDRIRLTTTGNLVFEAGIAAQTFSNNPAQATPTMIINTSSNVGIQTASPATTLDVAGTTRSQIVSTLALNVSTINGQTFGGPIQSTVIGLGLVGYISSSQLFSSLSGLVVGSTLGLSAGSVTAPLLSTLNINLCTINGQTFGGPIQSTVIGLGLVGYISSSQLFSSLSGLVVGSTLGLSAGSVTAPLLSTLNINLCTINGQTFGGPIQSTVIGLGLTGYISSTQLFSTVTGLGSGTGGGTSGSSIGVSTGQITAVSLSTLRILASSITASNATFSTLTTNSLTIGTGLGYLSFPPIQTTVISSIAAYGNVVFYTSTFLGNASSQTAIQFFGLNGLYRNTAIAEQSTGAGLQELLLFKGSSVSDRIRLTTTGNLIFEAGIAAQTFSNNPAQATPTMIINSSSNVGIQTASPATTLDVAGTTRSQIISTLNLNVCTINGLATFGSGGSGGAFTGSSLAVSTLTVYTLNTRLLTASTALITQNGSTASQMFGLGLDTLTLQTSAAYQGGGVASLAFATATSTNSLGRIYAFDSSAQANQIASQLVFQVGLGYGSFTTSNYSYTGSAQTFIVPAGVTAISLIMWGAGGGGGRISGSNGGAGAFIQGNLFVTPGQSLTVIVGGAGQYSTVSTSTTYGGGGATGPGAAVNFSGGGRSAIQFVVPITITSATGNGTVATYTTSAAHGLTTGSPIIISGLGGTGYTGTGFNGNFVVASVLSVTQFTVTNTLIGASVGGGTLVAELVDVGGGGSAGYSSSGGAATFTGTAFAGTNSASGAIGGGGGGSQTAGGAAGLGIDTTQINYGVASPGLVFTGGSGSIYNSAGGGGYFGGGAGATSNGQGGGGGGGSSWINAPGFYLIAGSNSPNNLNTAPATSSSNYVSGVAVGGLFTASGGPGYVVISAITPSTYLSEVIRMASNSYVGIGTSTPQTTLDVGGVARATVLSTTTLYAATVSTTTANTSVVNAISMFTSTITFTYNTINPNSNAGGTYTTYIAGNTTYAVHTFYATGSNVVSTATFTPTSNIINAQLLVVAGGGSGGGGGIGGGGGAGGLIYVSSFGITRGSSYTIQVGAGGGYTTAGSYNIPGAPGCNSVAFGYTAIGGGGGGSDQNYVGGNGGCGGGGSSLGALAGGTGSQGFNGATVPSSGGQGGGGGGMGSAGSNPILINGGPGGNGVTYSISGVPTGYAAGGGGCTQNAQTPAPGGSANGVVIGGLGGTSLILPTSGAPNTGSGGGGIRGVQSLTLQGIGGTGIVIVAYPITQYVGNITSDSNNNLSVFPLYNFNVYGSTQILGNFIASSVITPLLNTASLTTSTALVSQNGSTASFTYGAGIDNLTLQSPNALYAGGIASMAFTTAGYPLARIYAQDAGTTVSSFAAQLIFQSALATGITSTIRSFAYVGSNQSFTVPSGVFSINVAMWGAGGGGNGGTAGAGAFIQGNLAVTAGQVLTVVVGQGGNQSGISSPLTYGGGGASLPGAGVNASAGGRSAIQLNLTVLISSASGDTATVTYTTTGSHGLIVNQPVIITGLTPSGYNGTYLVTSAPALNQFTVSNSTTGTSTGSGSIVAELVDVGGGGAAANVAINGAAATYSGTAFSAATSGALTGGGGGSQSGGGAPGTGGNTATYGTPTAGSVLQGGNGQQWAGGGGGGYYGGGGGATVSGNNTGGGGGSSYISYTGFTLIVGSNSPNSLNLPPAQTFPGYVSTIARGGTAASKLGGSGYVILSYIPANLSEAMRIGSNGYVGIATSTPQYALDVGATLRAQNLIAPTANFNVVTTSSIQIQYGVSNVLSNAGGTYTTYTVGAKTYAVHTFNNANSNSISTSNFIPTLPISNAQLLVVAGGGSGGGGSITGGGGAGGVIYVSSFTINSGTYTIQIGGGGAITGNAQVTGAGSNGLNSSAFGNIAIGGGGGGGNNTIPGQNGGCGGGGVNYNSAAAAQSGGTGSQGFNGGTAVNGANLYVGAGGGGMGSIGGANSGSNGGTGGNGVVYTITGTAQGYAAGGGGGTQNSSLVPSGGSANGVVIGGNGAYTVAAAYPTNAVANTGSGGGGGNNNTTTMGQGSSGIVIIAYDITQFFTAGTIGYDAGSNIAIFPLYAFNVYASTQVFGTFYASSLTTSLANTALTTASSFSINATGNNPLSNAGGTYTTYQVGASIYAVHAFSNAPFNSVVTSNFVVPVNVSNVQVLVLGGGGGGGCGAITGGGGAGGLVYASSFTVTAGTYTIQVGGGGSNPGAGNTRALGSNGSNSVAFGYTGYGGGAGAADDTYYARYGGCGGGGCWYGGGISRIGGTAIQGFNGGSVLTNPSGYPGGGGGGMGSIGLSNTGVIAGKGGNGVVYSIMGYSVGYAAGGGGGAQNTTVTAVGGSANGQILGGSGASQSAATPTSAVANTGSGGGGGNNGAGQMGCGSSGVVIISYLINQFFTTASITYDAGSNLAIYPTSNVNIYGNLYASSLLTQIINSAGSYSSSFNIQYYAANNLLSNAGGTYTTYYAGSIQYAVHTFNNTSVNSISTSNFVAPVGVTAQILVVGGGGSGGTGTLPLGGGGGAGGLVYVSSVYISSGTYSIQIGGGGSGAGSNGSNSIAFGYTGFGGGAGGGDPSQPGKNGGCGGGGINIYAGNAVARPGGTGSQGFSGGTSVQYGSAQNGSGGGGMGSAGQASQANFFGGAGGNGVVYAITGSNVGYAAGGAGGTKQSTVPASGGSANGVIIGGNGASLDPLSATNGAPNTGSGGGGAGGVGLTTPGQGASGVVIIAYVINQFSQAGTISYDTGSNMAIYPVNNLNVYGSTQVFGLFAASTISATTLTTSSINTTNIGVNRYPPLFTLDVNGNARISSLTVDAGAGVTSTNTTFSLAVWGVGGAARVGATTWTQISDERLKEQIVDADLTMCYDDIKNVRLRRFTYRSTFFEAIPLKDKNVLGFIAQEVSTIQPKSIFVSEAFGIPDLNWLNIDQMNMALYGAVKQLMTMNDSMTSNVSTLSQNVLYLQDKISSLEGR
jgi:hypothetical protein